MSHGLTVLDTHTCKSLVFWPLDGTLHLSKDRLVISPIMKLDPTSFSAVEGGGLLIAKKSLSWIMGLGINKTCAEGLSEEWSQSRSNCKVVRIHLALTMAAVDNFSHS